MKASKFKEKNKYLPKESLFLLSGLSDDSRFFLLYGTNSRTGPARVLSSQHVEHVHDKA